MAMLTLMYGEKIVKEVAVGRRPIGIGRAPDNELPVDNPAVSNYHAKIYAEAGKLVVEDLNSLNGTFVNDLRIERAALHDGDQIHVGKHHIKVDTSGVLPQDMDQTRKATEMGGIDSTMVLDTKERRDLLQQASAFGEQGQFGSGRLRMATLAVLSGKTDKKEYILSNKLTVIGKSEMATIQLKGWLTPAVAAQISKRDDGYYIGMGDKTPLVNGTKIGGPHRLNDGDLVEICGVRLNFLFRE